MTDNNNDDSNIDSKTTVDGPEQTSPDFPDSSFSMASSSVGAEELGPSHDPPQHVRLSQGPSRLLTSPRKPQKGLDFCSALRYNINVEQGRTEGALMPGKPITVSESEYEVLSQAKVGFEQAQGKPVDWGRFLLFLLGLYILSEVTKPKED